jgi:hypothetical protein
VEALGSLVFVTISAAVMCWAAGEVLRSRAWWTAGAALALIHSVAAFGAFYQWSHDTARVSTAEQTAAVTGIPFSGGIYVNYAFLAVWLGDAAWWWMSPQGYDRRPPLISFAVRGFIFFIIVNGAVVFADGWARIVGLVSSAAVVITWSAKLWSHRGAISTAG